MLLYRSHSLEPVLEKYTSYLSSYDLDSALKLCFFFLITSEQELPFGSNKKATQPQETFTFSSKASNIVCIQPWKYNAKIARTGQVHQTSSNVLQVLRLETEAEKGIICIFMAEAPSEQMSRVGM